MQWDFSPPQVLAGEVEYSIHDFKSDLLKEIQANISPDEMSADNIKGFFDIVFYLCYFVSTNKSLEDMVDYITKLNPETTEETAPLKDVMFLKDIEDQNLDNIDMLRAIISGMAIKNIEAGMSVKEAQKALQNEIGVTILDS